MCRAKDGNGDYLYIIYYNIYYIYIIIFARTPTSLRSASRPQVLRPQVLPACEYASVRIIIRIITRTRIRIRRAHPPHFPPGPRHIPPSP